MFAAFPLALALASAVSAAPIAPAVIAAVDAALSLPTTIQTNNATWYYQAGIAGACGLYSEDSDLVVGLPLEFYNNTGSVSTYCGSYIVVTNVLNNATVTSRVADASGSAEILSLSVATYEALDGAATDLNTVTWRFANETEVAAAEAALSATPAAISTTSSAYTSVAAVAAAAVQSSSDEAETTSTEAYVAATTTTKAYVAPTTTTKAYTTTTTKYVAPTTTTTKYVAPTTTTKKTYAAATTTKSSSSSGGTYSGQATWFTQNGVAGACGSVNSDSAYIVALDSAMYNGGEYCGKSLTIHGNGNTITARVADECPSCASSGSLDLSVGAFSALASTDAGVVSITWSWA